jgi:hypothetical protein
VGALVPNSEQRRSVLLSNEYTSDGFLYIIDNTGGTVVCGGPTNELTTRICGLLKCKGLAHPLYNAAQ